MRLQSVERLKQNTMDTPGKTKAYINHFLLLSLPAFLILSYSIQVQAMCLLDFARIYIFSEVDGVVLMQGKPVSAAKVVRTEYKI